MPVAAGCIGVRSRIAVAWGRRRLTSCYGPNIVAVPGGLTVGQRPLEPLI